MVAFSTFFLLLLLLLNDVLEAEKTCSGTYYTQWKVSPTPIEQSEPEREIPPPSPLVLVTHTKNYEMFKVGRNLSTAAKLLLQKNDTSGFISLHGTEDVLSVRVLPASYNTSITMELDGDKGATQISVIGALVGTPDSFFGLTNISQCQDGQFIPLQNELLEYPVPVFDAGFDARVKIADNTSVIPEFKGVSSDNRTSSNRSILISWREQSLDPASVAAPCFPGDAFVTLRNGDLKRMDEVIVGDRVAVSAGLFSDVFMFTHKLADVTHEFVKIRTDTDRVIRLTEGHYLPLNGVYLPAHEAKKGDVVMLGDGSNASVVEVSTVTGTGLYNPQTVHGDIVVDGVCASTYTLAVERKIAHALLAPLRMAFEKLGMIATFLEAGADSTLHFISVLW